MSQTFKKICMTTLIAFLMIYMLIMPSVCIKGATFGLLLWFNKLLPTLLPFIILTQMLCSLGVISGTSQVISPFTQKVFKLDGSSFLIFIIGLIAGYPTGAKMTKQLLTQKQISYATAQKCLCFVNNCGPLFIIGTVGSILLQNVSLGYFLAFVHILSAFTMLFLSRFYNMPSTTSHEINTRPDPAPSLVSVFNQSVQGGMDTIVYVGGYIIFFSVISNILKHLPLFQDVLQWISDALHINYYFLSGIIYGSIEFSSGIALVCQSLAPTPHTLALICFILSFGGFCVFFQSSYVLQDSSLKLGIHLVCKLFQGILAYIYTLLFYPLFFPSTYAPYPLPSPKLIGLLFFLIASTIFLLKLYGHNTMVYSKQRKR